MSAAIIIGVACNYCGKSKPPSEIEYRPGGVKICVKCAEWHVAALELLCSGTPPRACQFCNRKVEEIAKDDPGEYIGMYVHGPVDGIYQVACDKCSDALRQKQRDRYRGTEFGFRRGI